MTTLSKFFAAARTMHGPPMSMFSIASASVTPGFATVRPRAVRLRSGGHRRDVEDVGALLHRPAVLLMDEASVGLDPASRRDLLAALRADVAARNTTVLWATHLVEEAVQADRVLVLHQGKLIADGTPAEVTTALGEPTLEAGFIRRTAINRKETIAA